MFTSIIALAVAIGFFNILFIIYSTFASKRRLRKDRYALVPVRAVKQAKQTPAPAPAISVEDLDRDYISDGVLLYSREDMLSQRFARLEGNHDTIQAVRGTSSTRFTMADFR